MMHMLFERCSREELNKPELYVHAAGGKRFKFEDNPSFFSLFGCITTVHLLDHRHFYVLGVVVVGQIKVLGHGKTSSMVAGIVIISLHRPKMLTKTVRKFTAGFSDVQHVTSHKVLHSVFIYLFVCPSLQHGFQNGGRSNCSGTELFAVQVQILKHSNLITTYYVLS